MTTAMKNPVTDVQWPVIPRRWVAPAPVPPEPDPVEEFFSAAEEDDQDRDVSPRRGPWARLTGAVGTVAAGAIAVIVAIAAPIGVLALTAWAVLQNVDPSGDLIGRLVP